MGRKGNKIGNLFDQLEIKKCYFQMTFKIYRKKNLFRERGLQGFSLMEILVYIGVLSIIVLVLSFYIVWSIHSANKLKTMREVFFNARRPIELMTHEIREAKSISPTSTATHLSLEKIDGSYIDFYLASSTIYQKEGSEAEMALTSNNVEVKNLDFKTIATGTTTPSVKISFTIDYKNPTNRPEYQSSFEATTTASLRSY